MESFTFRLIVLLLPGVIATIIFGKLVIHEKWTSFIFTLYSILFGLTSFLVLQIIILVFNQVPCIQLNSLSIWSSFNSENELPFIEVLFACMVALPLAILMSIAENRKIVFLIAKKFNISYKYGSENLYSRFLSDESLEFVYVRDRVNNIIYHGVVKSFSENEQISEISLGNVRVYEDGKHPKKMYEVESMYLSFEKSNVIIEKAIDKS